MLKKERLSVVVPAVNTLLSSGLIDEAGNVVPDTKLIVAVGPQWQLTAEGNPALPCLASAVAAQSKAPQSSAVDAQNSDCTGVPR